MCKEMLYFVLIEPNAIKQDQDVRRIEVVDARLVRKIVCSFIKEDYEQY